MIFIGKTIIINLIKTINNNFRNSVVLKLKNNKTIKFNISELKYYISETNKINLTIVKYFLKKNKVDKSNSEFLFNFLSLNDKNIWKLAKIIKYFSNKEISIKSISATFLSKEDISLFKKFEINVNKITTNYRDSLFLKMFYWILKKKTAVKKTAKIYPEKESKYNKDIKYTSILKSFGAHAEFIYINKLSKSLDNTIIYVFPYIYGFPLQRQKEYINQLKQQNRNYFFFSPKISFHNLLKSFVKIYFSSIPKKFKLASLIISYGKNYIDKFVELIKIKFPYMKYFYTSEEFQAKSVYRTEKLQEAKIKVINFAHGLGVYNTITNYNTFYVFSKIQEKHYRQFGNSKFEYFSFDFPTQRKDLREKERFAIFFVGKAVLSKISSSTFRNSYKKVIDFTERIRRELDIPIFAKYDPKSTAEDKVLSENIIIVENIEHLPEKNYYLSISIGSTYNLELVNKMPFLIINPDNKLDFNHLLPDTNLFFSYTYEDFKERISEFMSDKESFHQYWDKLLEIIREYFY